MPHQPAEIGSDLLRVLPTPYEYVDGFEAENDDQQTSDIENLQHEFEENLLLIRIYAHLPTNLAAELPQTVNDPADAELSI